ncbi:MAG TPA: hypothetical protein VEI95_17795 [Acidobacteriota bacterium]|nr:hypothetical protein [Acidobacteriota bacterium]
MEAILAEAILAEATPAELEGTSAGSAVPLVSAALGSVGSTAPASVTSAAPGWEQRGLAEFATVTRSSAISVARSPAISAGHMYAIWPARVWEHGVWPVARTLERSV